MSIDPWGGDMGDPQSFNKYSYTLNNPVKYVDPTGQLFFLAIPIAAIGTAEIAAFTSLVLTTVFIGANEVSPIFDSPERVTTTTIPVELNKNEPLVNPPKVQNGPIILENPAELQKREQVGVDGELQGGTITSFPSDSKLESPINTFSKKETGTPETNPGAFTKLKGGQGWRHNKTCDVYRKSWTQHRADKEWKIMNNRGTNGGSRNTNKESGNRRTVDGEGNTVGT